MQALQADALPAQEPEFGLVVDAFGAFPEDESWRELATRHFRVVGTLDDERLREVATDLETFRYRVSDWFPRVDTPGPVPTTVIILPDREPLRDLPLTAESGATTIFDLETPAYYIAVREADQATSRTVLREYTKLLLPEATILMPLWLREGLADYFSTFKVSRYPIGSHRLTKTGLRVDEHNGPLNSNRNSLIPIERLMRVTTESPEYTDPETRELYLAQSWAFVHYLLSRGDPQRGARSLVPATLELISQMPGDRPFDDLFKDAFGGSINLDFRGYLRESRDDWLHVIGGLSLNPGLERGTMLRYGMSASGQPLPPIQIPFGFDSVLEAVQARPIRSLPYGEALYHIGDLLLHLGHPGPAEALLEESSARFPEFAPPHASLARLKMSNGRWDEADRQIQEALSLDPFDCRTHLLKAVSIQARLDDADLALSSGDTMRVSQSLGEAISVCPGLAPAAQMQADLYLTGGGDANTAVSGLLGALRIAPGSESLLLSLAAVLARAGEESVARGLLDSLVAIAPDREVIDAASLLLASLETEEVTRVAFTSPGPVSLGEPEGVRFARNPASEPALPPTREGSSLEGLLIELDCEGGLTVVLRAGSEVHRFHTDAPGSVAFASNGQILTEGVICGPIEDGGVPVIVRYQPQEGTEYSGIPLVVEIR